MSNATSEFLKFNIDKIMKIWEERTRAEVRAASEQKSLALVNSLPQCLEKLVECLSKETNVLRIGANKDQPTDSSSEHGRTRAESQNYTIDQLISEYHILRQVTFEVLESEIKLSNIERDIIIDFVEQAVNDAATEFSDYLKTLQDNFSMALVHDLRSPLTTALFSVGMIESSPENLAHNTKVQKRIETSLERVNAMLYRLLDYSSIKAGHGLKMNFEQIDLAQLIPKLADDLIFSSTKRFVVKVPSQLIVFWDLRGITSILENLVTNAIKYSDPNSPIVISAVTDSGRVTIVVHNFGKPISAEDQDTLFQKFRRSDNVENEPGWGLGLTIVKSIVESHGGVLSCESSAKHGTSFTVSMPIDCRALVNNKQRA